MIDNSPDNKLLPVAGIRLGTVCAGIKQADRRDLVVIELSEGCQTAAVFTQNAFCAAPVIVAKQHIAQASPRYLLINTGNANAGTGQAGLEHAVSSCEAVAQAAGCQTNEVLPFSTGVIGEPLPVEKISAAVPQAVKTLADDGWSDAAHGIMTTDTVPKCVSTTFELDGKLVTITGIAKGSGMIRPDMATMLAYIATDARIEQEALQSCLQQAVNKSFNRITIDGDTSTNDACILMATGKSQVVINKGDSNFEVFTQVVSELCVELAKAMVRDGEGATKLINVDVTGGKTEQECLNVAYTIAHSPLVKTAFFASDPNWGRILAAVGRAGLDSLVLDDINIYLDDVCIVENGGRSPSYKEEMGQEVMDRTEITIRIVLGRGDACTNVWTCDFSYDYVRINAEYRT
ncbi:MAG: bifunctional glutamate N-acetyltransferase/amino-acid acetyltransferase ArgJ [Gammaproteobacteria bacterium]|nr:bifunctional glutamate N-acetyltransferase/amino-acid acetyltransferase ArgJ [Gammaproteobacteria bacterium]